ncbi:MAG: 4-hydroxythreonine-4-phosphate dehydrogenase PdxA, partial [Pseudomonadota bacterium]
MTAPIAVTCGEPAGIGPEIAARAFALLQGEVPAFWIGDPRHLPTGTDWREIANPAEALLVPPGSVPVLVHPFPDAVTPGAPSLANAAAVCAVIARAVDLVQAGEAGGICTTPIHKKVLLDGADFPHPGHTEYLEALTGAARAVMMLASPELRVVSAQPVRPRARCGSSSAPR